jgi:sulfatase maturation enzyme AslB (radical SAM superfamily)
MAQTAVGSKEVIQAWGKILSGYRPNLSIEITKECPLRCPGCYAYGDEHLGGGVTLRGLADYKGDELVTRFMALIDRHKPLHVSIVGGEPLVRYRELGKILPQLAERGVHAQVVTSAVRQIPAEWAALRRLQIVVSIDGLPAEHDVRRTPATYDRILKHIAGHQITVHCTITRQQVRRDHYLEEFLTFWQNNPHTRLVWMSLYTPQIGELSMERLSKGPGARGRGPAAAAAQVLEAAASRRSAQRLRAAARFAGKLHLRADDGMLFVGSRKARDAVPARRKS